MMLQRFCTNMGSNKLLAGLILISFSMSVNAVDPKEPKELDPRIIEDLEKQVKSASEPAAEFKQKQIVLAEIDAHGDLVHTEVHDVSARHHSSRQMPENNATVLNDANTTAASTSEEARVANDDVITTTAKAALLESRTTADATTTVAAASTTAGSTVETYMGIPYMADDFLPTTSFTCEQLADLCYMASKYKAPPSPVTLWPLIEIVEGTAPNPATTGNKQCDLTITDMNNVEATYSFDGELDKKGHGSILKYKEGTGKSIVEDKDADPMYYLGFVYTSGGAYNNPRAEAGYLRYCPGYEQLPKGNEEMYKNITDVLTDPTFCIYFMNNKQGMVVYFNPRNASLRANTTTPVGIGYVKDAAEAQAQRVALETAESVIDPDPKWTGQGILAMVIVILWSFMMLGVLLYFLLMSDTMSKAKTADEEQEMEDAEDALGMMDDDGLGDGGLGF